MERDAVVADGTDEDVGRIHGVRERGDDLLVMVGQRDRNIDLRLRIRDIVARFERTAQRLCLVLEQPFLKEGREGPHVDDLLRRVVAHGELSVSVQVLLRKAAPASCPARLLVELLQVDVLLAAIACKHIVESQRIVLKILFERLRAHLREEARNEH